MNKAPFSNIIGKDNRWIKQAVKRMLRWGVDNVYDRVAWIVPEDMQSIWGDHRNVQQITATFDTAQQYGVGESNNRPSIHLQIYKGKQEEGVRGEEEAYVDPFTGYLLKTNQATQAIPLQTNQTEFMSQHILDYTDAET